MEIELQTPADKPTEKEGDYMNVVVPVENTGNINVYDELGNISPHREVKKNEKDGLGAVAVKVAIAMMAVILVVLVAVLAWNILGASKSGNLSSTLGQKNGETKNLSMAVAELLNKNDHLRDDIGNLKDGMGNLIDDIGNLKDDIGNLKDGMGNLKDDIGNLKDGMGNLTEDIGNLKDGTWNLKDDIGNLKYDMGNLTEEVKQQADVLGHDIRNLTDKVVEQKDKVELINDKLGLTDCQEYRDQGSTVSGLYDIYLDVISRHTVYCDMATNGGGWTVLLRRKDGSVDFNQTWDAYRNGFGDLSGEFWAGNELMYRLTSRPGKTYRLRVELGSYNNGTRYAEYDVFRVDSELEFYRLHVSGYTGTAGDSLTYHDNRMFSTRDEGHDMPSVVCASLVHGGWWYQDCGFARLTGLYGSGLRGGHGIFWYLWLGWNIQLKSAVMMVRPV